MKNLISLKQNCMHCKKPGCVSACPVSALQKDKDDGVVLMTLTAA